MDEEAAYLDVQLGRHQEYHQEYRSSARSKFNKANNDLNVNYEHFVLDHGTIFD